MTRWVSGVLIEGQLVTGVEELVLALCIYSTEGEQHIIIQGSAIK